MIKYLQILKQKYFDDTIDLTKLSKSFLLWGSGVVLVYIGNIFLTRILSIEDYGGYAIIMNWVTIVAAFLSFGWDEYLIQRIPQIPVEADGKRKIGEVRIRIFISVAVMSLLYFLFGFGYSSFYDDAFTNTRPLLNFLWFLSLPLAVIMIFKSLLKVFDVVTPVQWFEDILKPLTLAILFGYFYFNHSNIDLIDVIVIVLIMLVSIALILLLLMVIKLRGKVSLKDKLVEGSDPGWIRRCFYFLCIGLGYTFFSKMELLFLGIYNQAEDAGRYQILLRIADLIIIPDFLFNYYLPQKFSHLFTDKKKEEAERLFRKAARIIFVLQVICLAFVAGVGYFYLKSFRVESPMMYVLLIILCSSQLFYSLFGSTNLVLMTSGNEKYSFLALSIVLVLEAIANILWIPGFGLQAAVYISWASVLLYTLILSFFVRRKLSFTRPII